MNPAVVTEHSVEELEIRGYAGLSRLFRAEETQDADMPLRPGLR
jgi:hypothetical protein